MPLIRNLNKNISLNHFQIIENEMLYGPGKRLVLTYQGCSLHCYGCINKHLWPFNARNMINIQTILNIIKNNKLDGVTLYGGEPLDQAHNTLVLVNTIKIIDKTVILFTGYDFKELNNVQKKIWDASDIVISGRFILAQKKLNLQFRGSTNQKIYLHKGKYKNYKIKDGVCSTVFTIHSNGEIIINGFLTNDIIKLFDTSKIKK